MGYKEDFETPGYTSAHMAGRPPITEATDSGKRLARLRNDADLTQGQLADAVGIPVRSVSFYERKAQSIPSHLLPLIADALGVSVETVIGGKDAKPARKPGPKSDVEHRFEAIRKLSKRQQKKILDVVDAMLAQAKASAS